MKNLRRAFAVVVALTMVLSTVAFASVFTDVKDDNAYAEPIELGVALNLFKGYEDGSFKPEGDITRAEFAAIVVRALGQEAQVSGAAGATKFTDVPSTHWAAGYVNLASGMGIIAGYGDGKFGPEDKVTYEQAVKMTVVALGYGPIIDPRNYPVAYLTVAQQKGMTTNVKGTNGVPINRGQVAQLIFNSLDVPLLEQVGFGTNLSYQEQNGLTNGTVKKTLLSEKLGVVKLRVAVTKSYEAEKAKKSDIVQINIVNNYNTKYDDKDEDGEELDKGEDLDINVGKTLLKSLVGYNAMLYVEYDETSSDEPVAVYAKKDTKSVDELVVASADLDSVSVVGTGNSAVATVKYEVAGAKALEDLEMLNKASVYINGYLDKNVTVQDALTSGTFYGEATFALLDSKSDYDYDTLFVTTYENVVIDYVNTSSGMVTLKDMSAQFATSFDDDQYSITIYDVNGKEVDWKTLKEFDILSVRKVSGSAKSIYIATLVNEKVSGAITEIGGADNDQFTIGGKVYEVDGINVTANMLSLKDEGDFYLDVMGNIAYYELGSSLSGNYAYVIETEYIPGITNSFDIQMFNYKGEVVTLKTASTFYLYYVDGASYTNKKITSSDLKTDVDGKKTLFEGKVTADTLITYDVNSSGAIDEIKLVNTLNEGAKDKKDLTKYAEGDGEYTSSTDSIKVGSPSKRAYIGKNTVIMHAPEGADTDAYELLAFEDDISSLTDVEIYDVDKDSIAGLILIKSLTVDMSNGGTNLALFKSNTKTTNADGDDIGNFTFYQNKESVTLPGTREVDPDDAFDAGDAFVPAKNAKGELTNTYKTIAKVSGSTVAPVIANFNTAADAANDVVYYLGKATDIKSSRLTLDVTNGPGAGQEDDFSIPANANVYVYDDSATSKNRVALAGTNFINVFYKQNNKLFNSSTKKEVDVYVLIREYEGKNVDVVIYMFEK